MDDNTNDPQSQMREDSFSADYTQADGANANMEPSELAEKLDPNIAGQEQQTLAQVDSEGVEIATQNEQTSGMDQSDSSGLGSPTDGTTDAEIDVSDNQTGDNPSSNDASPVEVSDTNQPSVSDPTNAGEPGGNESPADSVGEESVTVDTETGSVDVSNLIDIGGVDEEPVITDDNFGVDAD